MRIKFLAIIASFLFVSIAISSCLDLTRILTVQFNGENQGFEEYLETISPEANASAA